MNASRAALWSRYVDLCCSADSSLQIYERMREEFGAEVVDRWLAAPEVHPLPDPLNDEPCGICGGAGYHRDGCRWLYENAATTPPPVRVVRLDGPAWSPWGAELAFAAAADAATSGARAIEAVTSGNEGAAGSWAYTAARFARLALGTSALLLALALPASALQQPECAADTLGAGGGCVNVNTATAAELEHLHRIGPALAQRIVEDRETNGPFASMLDLERVKGIGGATVCLNQRAVVFSGPSSRVVEYRPEEAIVTSCKADPSAGNCVDC